MPPPHARDTGLSRRSWLLAGLALPLFQARGVNELGIVYEGEDALHSFLRPVVQDLHFLTGKPLERLHDAEKVVFASWLSLYTIDQSVPFRQAYGRFVMSYDIWEQKFMVTIPGPAPRSKGDLTAHLAEAWCLDNLAISASGLAADRVFFLRLELRTEQRRELSSVLEDPGISLLRPLVELFSRKARPDEPHWGPFESGRLRLSELVRMPGRGPRG
jgi:hypothetical protein